MSLDTPGLPPSRPNRRRVLGLGVAAVVVAVVGAGLVHHVSEARLARRYTVPEEDLTVPDDAASVELGAHLYRARGCSKCHGEDLAGGDSIPELRLGHLWGPNLTRGRGGVGDIGASAFVRVVRHGVRGDGSPVLMMPAQDYTNLSDRELGAILAFLRHAPPVDRATPPHDFGLLARGAFLLGFLPLVPAELIDHHAPRAAAPDAGETPAFGRYLASISCMSCHGATLAGGPFPGAPPGLPVPSNLTLHEHGLRTWTRADFFRAMRTGLRPDGRELDSFMPWRTYGHMNDTELGALWAFLRSLPPTETGVR